LAGVAAAFFLAAVGSGSTARAQTGTPDQGALQFLAPVGARSIAMGEAAVALSNGSEGMWWNPALVSRGPREASLHIGNTFASADGGADFAASVLFPVRGVGAFALGIRSLISGPIDAVDSLSAGGLQTGTFQERTNIIVATFSAPFGDRLSAGVSLKYLQLTLPCTGTCDLLTSSPKTGAVDLGMQYVVLADSTITLGAALRTVGPKLQFNDSPQADPLPTILDVGVAFVPHFSSWPKEVRVRGAADVVSLISGSSSSPGYRVGAEISYFDRLVARGGYVVSSPTGSGPTIGFGFSTGRLQIDFAQARSDLNNATGKQPSYLSLSYSF
jgi:hypothetical protein